MPGKRERTKRPQLDILFGNGKGDIGVLKEPVLCKDICKEIKTMTEVLRDPRDRYGVLPRGITIAERISCLTSRWRKTVVAVRTRTGVAVLNDAYGGGAEIYSGVEATYQQLRHAGLDTPGTTHGTARTSSWSSMARTLCGWVVDVSTAAPLLAFVC